MVFRLFLANALDNTQSPIGFLIWQPHNLMLKL